MTTIRHVLFIAASLKSVLNLEIKPEAYERNSENCFHLIWEPYFEPELVIGKPWKVYYTWNMDWGKRCMDMKFKSATPKIVERVQNDMGDYLQHQPLWDAATLLLTTGNANHELLLFVDQGPAGAFSAVPNVIRDSNMAPSRGSILLLKFHLKLIEGGKYLIMMDCHIGVATLSARADVEPPSRELVSELTKQYNLGIATPSCVKITDKIDRYID